MTRGGRKNPRTTLRESEQDRNHEDVGSWASRVNGENVSSSPRDVKRESLLVEWAHGQGLTFLPHPPLLSNNFPQLTNNISLNGWLTHGKLPIAPMA